MNIVIKNEGGFEKKRIGLGGNFKLYNGVGVLTVWWLVGDDAFPLQSKPIENIE